MNKLDSLMTACGMTPGQPFALNDLEKCPLYGCEISSLIQAALVEGWYIHADKFVPPTGSTAFTSLAAEEGFFRLALRAAGKRKMLPVELDNSPRGWAIILHNLLVYCANEEIDLPQAYRSLHESV